MINNLDVNPFSMSKLSIAVFTVAVQAIMLCSYFSFSSYEGFKLTIPAHTFCNTIYTFNVINSYTQLLIAVLIFLFTSYLIYVCIQEYIVKDIETYIQNFKTIFILEILIISGLIGSLICATAVSNQTKKRECGVDENYFIGVICVNSLILVTLVLRKLKLLNCCKNVLSFQVFNNDNNSSYNQFQDQQ